MTEHKSIPKLISKAREGDRAAFEELLAPLAEPLRAAIAARMSPALQQKLGVEDVLQETLLRAYTSIKYFQWQGEGSLRYWLEGIAANFILHSARTQGRKRELQLKRDPKADVISPSRHQRRRERYSRLRRSVEDLSPDYRTVILLSRIEGLKIREIAERMGRSESAIKNLLFKAMRQLRESFGDTESMGLPCESLGDIEAKNGNG